MNNSKDFFKVLYWIRDNIKFGVDHAMDINTNQVYWLDTHKDTYKLFYLFHRATCSNACEYVLKGMDAMEDPSYQSLVSEALACYPETKEADLIAELDLYI